MVRRVNPSPEIVTLPRRPHIATWGNAIAWPLLLLIFGGPLIILAIWLFFRREPEAQAAVWLFVAGLLLVGGFVVSLANAIRRRRQSFKDLSALETRLDNYIARLGDPRSRSPALLRLAQLASLRASRHGGWFDVALWDRATADCCPRVIIAVPGIDLARPVEAVAEEFDLITEPRAPLRSLIGEAALWLILLALAAIMLERQGAADPLTGAIILGAAALIAAVHLCRRAAIRLIAIRSAVASPGRIEFGGLFGTATFTIDDAMVFVVDRNQDAAGNDADLEIIFHRTDHVSRRIRLTGPGDPRLAEALARWTVGRSLSKNSAPSP